LAPAHHDEPPAGLMRWLTTTNHKDIGTLYLVFALTMLFVGGAMALVIRAELFQPGLQIVNPHFFNQMTTLHALVMIFGAVMPAFTGFANWQIPLMIGAPDMALPRLNNWSFWLLPFAFTLLLSSLFVPGGGPAGGWTLYPPLSVQGSMGTDFTILAIHMMGISSVLGAINVIATILNMRAPGMTLLKILFFGHPGVYILFLRAFATPSQITPPFARKPLFGYESMVYATASIAFLSFIVWAHHMFTTGMPLAGWDGSA